MSPKKGLSLGRIFYIETYLSTLDEEDIAAFASTMLKKI
tara:strand:- start:2704 stop:2820 length:117 start_codon:yes stop_codon:yes gene_type:complete